MGNAHSSKKASTASTAPPLSQAQRRCLDLLVQQNNLDSAADLLVALSLTLVAWASVPEPYVLNMDILAAALRDCSLTKHRDLPSLTPTLLHSIDSTFTAASNATDTLMVRLSLWIPIFRTMAGVCFHPPEKTDPSSTNPNKLPFSTTTSVPIKQEPTATPIVFAPILCALKHSIAVSADMCKWAQEHPTLVPGVSQLLAYYLVRPYLVHSIPMDPSCLVPDRLSGFLIPHLGSMNGLSRPLLQPDHILQLVHALPAAYRVSWRLAFASVRDGRSWTAFNRGIFQTVNDNLSAASVLVVIRDTGGCTFGAFINTVPILVNPKFQQVHPIAPVAAADPVFLFRVRYPGSLIDTYGLTGINDHHLYMNSNSASLPSGLGFGGQLDFFGLWLDSSLDFGHSRVAGETSLTFGNPCLASKAEFNVADIEAWVIEYNGWERNPDLDIMGVKVGSNKQSVVDQFPELVELLELSGRRMYSKEVPNEPVEFDD